MAKFREVLKNRNFLFLWLGQIISQFGERLSQMALIALIYARAPGSTWQLAKVFSFTIIPVFLVGPFACAYVDRWDRRRTMLFCELARAVLVASIALISVGFVSLWPIYIIIFLVFSASRFFVPAKMAIIPELVSQDKLLLANSLSSTTGMIAAVAGFGLGGLIVERAGSSGGFFINAFTYLLSGIFILMIVTRAASYFKKEGSNTTKAPDAQTLFKKSLIAEFKEGWQYLVKDRDLRFIAQIFFLLGSAIGTIYVVIIVFVQKTLGSVTQDVGILAMLLGLGLFSGSLIYGRFVQKLSRTKTIFISLGSSGIALSLFAVSLKVFSSTLFAAPLSFILGLALSPIIISSYTLIHEVSLEKMRGRIFGMLEMVAYSGLLLCMFLSSFLAEKIGRFWILLFVGVILTIMGFGAILLKLDRRAS